MRTPFFLFESFLDILYPPTCIQCRTDGSWLCPDCLDNICHRETTDEILAIGAYADPALRKMLTSLKYRSAFCLKGSLRELVRSFRSSSVDAWPWAGEPTLLVCGIPSDPRRIRERGIDHLEILLDLIMQELAPWGTRSHLLKKTKHIEQNANLPANELRLANIMGVFKATTTIEGAVLLVDDVYTTGATWHEAANTLKRAGASQVYGLVFARKMK